MMDIYEPLFLLSVGAVDGDPGQNDWDIEPVSYATLESFCAAHEGETVELFPAYVVERLRAENKTFRAAQKACEDCEDISGRLITWTKCSDALPDDNKIVLIAYSGGVVQTGYRDRNSWWLENDSPVHEPVSYWAKKPAHPEEK